MLDLLTLFEQSEEYKSKKLLMDAALEGLGQDMDDLLICLQAGRIVAQEDGHIDAERAGLTLFGARLRRSLAPKPGSFQESAPKGKQQKQDGAEDG